MRLLTSRAAIISGLLLSFSCQSASADEADELMARAKTLQTESQELIEHGHLEEGEKVHEQSNVLWTQAIKLLAEERAELAEQSTHKEHGPEHAEIQQLKERIQDLDEAQRRAASLDLSEAELNALSDKREALEQELERRVKFQSFPPEHRAQVEKLEIAQRRLKHIRVAAENLKAAEMHDMAHELTRRADDMERDIHNAKAELGRKMHGNKPNESDRENDIRRLKMENEELREQMKKLTEVVERLVEVQAK